VLTGVLNPVLLLKKLEPVDCYGYPH